MKSTYSSTAQQTPSKCNMYNAISMKICSHVLLIPEPRVMITVCCFGTKHKTHKSRIGRALPNFYKG